MNRETKLDIIELGRAYLGVGLFSWWGLWSGINHDIPFTHLTGFLTSLGGIL